MELRQLKYFLAVAENRSFVNAANKLYISRQAVSKAVSQLETELGTELFIRDLNGAYLTPTGLIFYERVRDSVMELEGLRREMQSYGSGFAQRIRLVFSVGLLPLYEQELFRFRQERDNVELDYQECPEYICLEMLREHKADLAVCAGNIESADLSIQTLAHSPYGILMKYTEDLAALDMVEMQDLSWLPLAGLADSSTGTLCERYNLHLQFAGLDLYRLISLAQSGKCALLLPKCLAPNQFKDLLWLPLSHVDNWSVQAVCLRTMEDNVLYNSIMNELQTRIFHCVPV